MKKMLLLLILAAPTWADSDDIYIVSPLEKETVSGMVTLQVQSPTGNPASIDAWMNLDKWNAPDQIVWKGKLNQADNYTTQINTAGFAPGEYDIEVRYFFNGRIYDENVEVYIK